MLMKLRYIYILLVKYGHILLYTHTAGEVCKSLEVAIFLWSILVLLSVKVQTVLLKRDDMWGVLLLLLFCFYFCFCLFVLFCFC